MFFGPETPPLDIRDDKVRIHVELDRYDTNAVDDFNRGIQFQYRKNIVLTYYNYNDVDGNWGTVDEHHISTADLSNISEGLQSLLSAQSASFEYETAVDSTGVPFVILRCKRNDNQFSLRIQIAEGHFQEWLVVELSQLTLEQFSEYAQVFIRWAKDYPILSDEELAIPKEVPW